MSIIQKWNGKKIHIRPDRYVCATDMAKATGKQWKEFLKLDSTREYLHALAKRVKINIQNNDKWGENHLFETYKDKASYLIESKSGTGGGTYFYPKLAYG